MDYARTSLAEVTAGLSRIAVDARQTFGALAVDLLNWRPDESAWSGAQCLQHLVTANGLMIQAAERALDGTSPKTIWQRLPLMPGIVGPMLIRSQAPTTTRRFVAPAPARPSSSGIGPDVVARFVTQHEHAVTRLHALDERQAARTIMISPFVRFMTYSVLDGWRLIYAHDLRHLQQARAVIARVA